MRRSISILVLSTCLWATIARGQEESFEPLFPSGDLTGWIKEGDCGFTSRNGQLQCSGKGNYPTWLRSDETFENFILRFEFKLGLYGEGGIFLHAPLHGRNSNVGFEIQLSDELRDRKPAVISTGAIFGVVPPAKKVAKPLGEWNDVEVLMDWPRLQVTINGEQVQDLNVEENPELRHRLRSGFLGLQDRGKPHVLRNLRIKRLPSTDTAKNIFNGKDLTGWSVLKGGGSATFEVVDGAIVASRGNGYLLTDEEYQNFDLFCYVQADPEANGGIFLRWKSLVPKDRGYEIQIEDIADSNNPTGSIYDWSKASGVLSYQPGEWFPMQIHVRDRVCVVRVNGVTVAQADDLEIVRPGPIALQMHSLGKTIRFKDIIVRRL